MQQFRADLHIHSRYSRATSSKLTPRNLVAWAAVKGISVLGSGDFTHATWRKELAESLVYDEASGLYAVRPGLNLNDELPAYSPLAAEADGVRFMLQGEISSIYKRGGKVRKVHNLVFMPTMEAAERFCTRLAQIGNLESDGRPIVGLDSRNLLEMVLETDPGAFLIPAHIWTPWFSIFGSKSGFDSIEECFGDLSGEIFALETGLSSDPEMNRMWSALDRYKLVSNSDAHSGENLGREVNLFSGGVSYQGIHAALKNSSPDCRFLGTLEFFPEEGKYHLDGHRACDVVLDPQSTRDNKGLCPVCGKPVTVGVLHRVMELADRSQAQFNDHEMFLSLIPLAELLGEILHVGSKSRKVADMHAKAIARFGSELSILQNVPSAELAKFLSPLGEAVSRMRRGQVLRQSGYDGEYGKVTVFSHEERREMARGALLAGFTPKGAVTGLTLTGEEAPLAPKIRRAKSKTTDSAPLLDDAAQAAADGGGNAAQQRNAGGEDPSNAPVTLAPEASLLPNDEQQAAISAGPGPVFIIAGPGTGKTRTLVQRVVHLLTQGESPRTIVAVTFTRRAATEMDERLALALGAGVSCPRTDTLHALAFELWHKTHDEAPVLLSEESARRVFAEANADEADKNLPELWTQINLARERREKLGPELAPFLERYFRQKAAWNLADYTDLLEFWLEQIQTGLYTPAWKHLLVDEIQDLSTLQLTLLQSLLPSEGTGFFGIGDPDQSIYSFRGAHGQVREFLNAAWPGLTTLSLRQNYRSAPGILRMASALLQGYSVCGDLQAHADTAGQIHMFDAPTAESEAVWVAAHVRALVGQGSHSLQDRKSPKGSELPGAGEHSLGDIAILVRVRAMAGPLQRALTRQGILAAVPEAEAFWQDPRVGMIIAEAGRMLGISGHMEGQSFSCPEKILARGPLGIAAYLSTTPPFDVLFWQSSAFKALTRAFDAHKGWAGLINWVNLQTDLELVRARSERIQIMSLHAAKGLEFRSVFLPCLEDGILPFAGIKMLTGHLAKDTDAPTTDEERRLLYVGITRAKQNLFLSHAGRRQLFGKDLRLRESRFLTKLPRDGVFQSALVARQKRDEHQLNLL